MKKIILLLIAAMMLTSCTSSGSNNDNSTSNDNVTNIEDEGTLNFYSLWRGEQIEDVILVDIEKANTELLQSLTDKDAEKFDALCTAQLSDALDDAATQQFFDGFAGSVTSYDYSALDTYHINFYNSSDGFVKIEHTEEDAFDFYVNSVSNNLYISLLLFDSEYGEILLTNFYIEQGDELKLYASNYLWYSLYGMDTMDYYEKSMEHYENDYIVPAYINMLLSYDVSTLPSYIQYKNIEEISEYYQKIYDEYNEFLLQSQLFDLEDENSVFALGLLYTDEKYVVEIRYLTDITINDMEVENIEAQAQQVHDYVCEVIPGFESSFTDFAYTAFNTLPTDPNEGYKSYTTVINKE